MCCQSPRYIWIVLIILSSSFSAAAAEPGQKRKLGNNIKMLQAMANRGLIPPSARQGSSGQGEVAGMISFQAEPSPELLHTLEASGVRFHQPEGRILHIGLDYPAWFSAEAGELLESRPEVVRVDGGYAGPTPMMEDGTMTALALEQAYSAGPYPLTGEGITIGVVDSWFHQFHPGFFRADGGLFNWIDVNEDGVFQPEIDGVDLDGDGELREDERLHVLKSSLVWYTQQGATKGENLHGDLIPDLDWLYLDTNFSGRWDFGPDQGFTEDTPAYGEPIFLADDVDGSGTLDPGEGLLRLGTSKVRKIYSVGENRVYERGVDLIRYAPSEAGFSHSTMTIGELVFNNPPYQRLHGVVPDAEILLAERSGAGEFSAPMLAGLAWLGDQGVDVVLHEYAWPMMDFSDGSSQLEQAIDTMSNEMGIPNCLAAGNFAGSNMHGVPTIDPGEVLEVNLETGIKGPAAPQKWVYINLRWRQPETSLGLTLGLPDGTEVPIPTSPDSFMMGGFNISTSGIETSPRGTTRYGLNFGSYQGLGRKTFKLKVENLAAEPVAVDMFLADETGYLLLASWDLSCTDQGTIAWPATADTAISAGAYLANPEKCGFPVESLDLAPYSSRGPRIDGAQGVDFVTPADLIAPWFNPTAVYYPTVIYSSGTSGSTPILTGIVAMILQAHPEATPALVQEHLMDGAVMDDLTGPLPNLDWGYGRLSAHRALAGGADPGENTRPVLVTSAPAEVTVGSGFSVDLTASRDQEDSGALELRWDEGYQGETTDWVPLAEAGLIPCTAGPEPGTFKLLVELRDPGLLSARKLIQIPVVEQPSQPDAVEQDPGEQDSREASDTASFPDLTGTEIWKGEDSTSQNPGKPSSSAGCTSASSSDSSPWLIPVLGILLGIICLRRSRAKPEPLR